MNASCVACSPPGAHCAAAPKFVKGREDGGRRRVGRRGKEEEEEREEEEEEEEVGRKEE